MKRHKRALKVEAAVRSAKAALSGLTPGEELQAIARLVSETVGLRAKYDIREERHGNRDEPGDVE